MKIQVGDTVMTDRFGLAKITGIEFCEEEGQKEGIVMQEIFAKDVNRCVFDFAEIAGWQFGTQIDFVQT